MILLMRRPLPCATFITALTPGDGQVGYFRTAVVTLQARPIEASTTALLKPFPAAHMRAFPVDRRVGDPKTRMLA
jgi:hypothetical protein